MFASWSASRRIYAGFGLVMALIVVLGATAIWAALRLSGLFEEYRGTARQSVAMNALAEDLFEARMAALKYRLAPDEATAQAVASNIEEVTTDAGAVRDLFRTPEAFAALEAAQTEGRAYIAAFDQMRAHNTASVEQVATLSALGPEIRKKLTFVMESAYRDGDPRAAYYAGRAQEKVMLGRFYAERYILRNVEEVFARANEEFAHAQTEGQALLAELQNPERRAAATEALALLGRYVSAFDAAAVAIRARNAVAATQLDAVGPRLQEALNDVLERIVDRQDEIGPQGVSTAWATKIEVGAVALLAILLAFAAAYAIGGSLSRVLRELAERTGQLSEGDLDVEITGAEHEHELGRMARALRVFKENAQEKERLAAVAAEEQNAAAERARVMDRLLEEVGVAVDSAVAGDFSQIVSAPAGEADLAKLAEALNQLMRAVGENLAASGEAVRRVAEGDLQQRMDGVYEGAFGELQSNINATIDRIAELVGKIQTVSGQLRAQTNDITDSSTSLAQRAEMQASSLEETAATMEEMSATIKANADSAAKAGELAHDASGRADAGGEVVQQTVTAMSQIEASSQRISDIITVIDGIAFQTNLLALNAAVEAARAGDAGKGFAVVASEVRTLAQRASEAARDIKELIQESTGHVSDGVRLVEETGSALTALVDGIKSVSTTVTTIAEASREQASGVEEISSAVSHMDEMTQQNSAMAEASVGTARELASAADELRELVGFFRTGREQVVAAAIEKEATEDAHWRAVEAPAAEPERGEWANF